MSATLIANEPEQGIEFTQLDSMLIFKPVYKGTHTRCNYL